MQKEDLHDDVRIEITDVSGRIIYRQLLSDLKAGNNRFVLHPAETVPGLGSGIYFVSLISGGRHMAHKRIMYLGD